MSHFSKIHTTLKDLNLLKQSLTDLSVQWDAQSQTVRGYKEQTSFANLVIQQNNNYDIGFTWNGFEYQLVADLQFWQQPWSVESFLDKVSQRYAYNSIIQATKKQGFEAVEEVNQDNGTIKLTLQRWNP
uniref:Uncharacterized protein ycf35 n=1 Tax=Rhodomonas salina TaxID=3034 RepID=A6MVS3_RHDSA|nr:Ycf35 [Rhodomonas salina]ABO70848.1 hypothetical plastid protein 35 [Rhodomonas salina]